MIHGAKGGSMKMKYMAAWCKLLGFFFMYISFYIIFQTISLDLWNKVSNNFLGMYISSRSLSMPSQKNLAYSGYAKFGATLSPFHEANNGSPNE